MRECALDPDTVGEAESRRLHGLTDATDDDAAAADAAVHSGEAAPAETDAAAAAAPTADDGHLACSAAASLYTRCKLQQLDMRSRMRGNKALR